MTSDTAVRAQKLYDLGRFAEALAEFARVVARDPEDAHSVSMMALCETNLGRKRQAVHTARRAVALQPDGWLQQQVLAIACSQAGWVNQAHKAVDEAVRIDPSNSNSLVAKAAICAQGNDWQGAVSWSRQALEADPDNEEAANVLAEASAYTGRMDVAVEVGRQVLHENPDSADAHSTNGFINLRQGKHRFAAAHFREALRLDPHCERAAEGMRIALRSIFPIYRWFVQLQLWLAGKGQVARYAIIIAILGVPRALRVIAIEDPRFVPLAVVVGVPFGLFLLMSWFGDGLTNIVLCFHPFGRLLLDRAKYLESVLLCALLTMALLGALVSIANTATGVAIAAVSILGFVLAGLGQRIESVPVARRVVVWGFGPLCLLVSVGFLVSFPGSSP